MKALWSDESCFVLIFSLAVPIRLTLENPSIRDRSYQQWDSQSYQCWAKERTLPKLILYISEITADSDAPSSATGTRRSDPHNQWDECFDTSKSERIPALFNRKSSFRMHFPRFLLNRLGIGPYNQVVLLHQGGIGTGSIRPCKNISVFSQKRGKSCFFLV